MKFDSGMTSRSAGFPETLGESRFEKYISYSAGGTDDEGNEKASVDRRSVSSSGALLHNVCWGNIKR